MTLLRTSLMFFLIVSFFRCNPTAENDNVGDSTFRIDSLRHSLEKRQEKREEAIEGLVKTLQRIPVVLNEIQKNRLIKGLKLDSINVYGGGDVFGKISAYTGDNKMLVIDSLWQGEYGYKYTFYTFQKSPRKIKSIGIKKSELDLDKNDNTVYKLTQEFFELQHGDSIEYRKGVNISKTKVQNIKIEMRTLSKVNDSVFFKLLEEEKKPWLRELLH